MVDKQQVIDFLLDLAWTWKVEINNLNSIVKFNEALWKPNIYFCCWYDKANGRCSDNDFTKKKYIPFDIDIRLNHYERTWEIMTAEQMDKVIQEILDKVENTSEFSWYSYAVNSWNGLHLYYVWDEIQIDRDTYSKWVEYLQWMLNEIIAPYECDMAVKNIARIMRLPWTINHRKKEHWGKVLWNLWDYECEFIKYRPWTLTSIVETLPLLAEEQNKKVEEEKKINEEARVLKKSQSDRDEINNIDVWELACEAWWVSIWSTRWNNVALREQHKNMWAYIYKPYNIVVNTWSSLICEKWRKTFTPYDIVYYEMMNKDTKRTLEYFKEHYHVEPKNNKQPIKQEIEIPTIEHSADKWYLYPAKVFDDKFKCFRAEELVVLVAEPNSWKTTFALDVLTRNKVEKWRKGYYINLEFDIRNVWRKRWLDKHWYDKSNLTDLAPLSDEEQYDMDKYVNWELSKFEYYNNPNWMDLEELVQLLIEKAKEWYEIIVIDTLWDIHGNSWNNSWSSQNKTMQTLQSIVQKTWISILLLHHMNKNGQFSGSQKIKDYSNVFISVSTYTDTAQNIYTTYSLLKDKIVWNCEFDCYYRNWEYILDGN